MNSTRACVQRVFQHILLLLACMKVALRPYPKRTTVRPYINRLDQHLPSLPSTNTVMPRDMSYRKPVPRYIPSPPPSPATAQEESNFEECSVEEIPPVRNT